ncbi:MAG: isoamylase early set domain-containing protein [Caldilineaceae bacterium]
MMHKQLSPKPDHVRILFELPAELRVDQVFLVGDFNNWDASATPFIQTRDGTWRATVDLPTQTCHAFCYLVGTRWQNEHQADGWTQSTDGRLLSMVEATLAERESDRRWQKIFSTTH